MPHGRTPRVLVVNDDGPPSDESPFVHGLIRELNRQLDWRDIRVCLPASQKSWVGKAYMIKQQVEGHYYYPAGPDGRAGTSASTTASDKSAWILLEGTPASCANIALNNIFPGEIDLVVSGPNYGRNTSSAFALSSGTVGAALCAALSGIPAIALSYGIFEKPFDDAVIQRAHDVACLVIDELWQHGFAHISDSAPMCYNVNVPLLPSLLDADRPLVRWTRMAEKTYGRLFTPVSDGMTPAQKQAQQTGPTALTTQEATNRDPSVHRVQLGEKLAFRFAPDLTSLVNPSAESLQDGTDICAITSGCVSVTPMRAAYAVPDLPDSLKERADARGHWKL